MSARGTRLAIATAVSVAVVCAAPFIGRARDALQEALPGYDRAVVVAVVSLAIGAALALAAVQIHDRRRLRFGALAAAVVIGATYARAMSTGNADIDAVERFHFVVYGLIAFLFYRVWHASSPGTAFALPLCAGLVVACADEWLQWFVPFRYGELRDVLLNGVALLCGLLVGVAFQPPSRVTTAVPAAGTLPLAASAALLAGAFFVDAVHLGHEIVDPAAGTFRSRYRPATLATLADERSRQWRDASPLPLRGVSREDHYLSEGQWHVQRRNEALEAGDRHAAWRENLILETYYAPVLDLDSRWSPDERARIGRLAGPDSADYHSAAAPHPIYVLPRWILWSAVTLLLGAIWAPLARTRTTSRAASV